MGNNHFQTFQDNLYPHRGLVVHLRVQLLLLKEMLNSRYDMDRLQERCQFRSLQGHLGISHQYPRHNLNKPLPNSLILRPCMDQEEGPTVPRPTSIPTVHRDLERQLHRRPRRPRQNLTTVCLISNNPLSLNKVLLEAHKALQLDHLQGVAVCNN